MSLIEQRQWEALRNRANWSLDVNEALNASDAMCLPRFRNKLGLASIGITLTKHDGKDMKGKKVKVKEKGKGIEFDIGSAMEVSQVSELIFPTGYRETAEFGIGKTRLILDKKPTDATWEFELDLPRGASLAYQPMLTQSEIDNGAVRPGHITGSYAVYLGGIKIGHIYRPFAKASNGQWVWLNMEVVGNKLRIFGDINVLRDMALPIEIDPSMGYTSAGASTYNDSKDFLFMPGPYNAAGSATSISIYCFRNPAAQITLGIYDATKTLIMDTSGGNTPTSAGWSTLNLDSAATLVAGMVYWLAHNHNTGNMTMYYDSVDLYTLPYLAITYVHGTLPAGPLGTLGGYFNKYRNSVYATFTAAEVGPTLQLGPFESGAWR